MTKTERNAVRNQLLKLANRAEEVRSELEIEANPQTIAGDTMANDSFRPAELHNRAAEEVVTSQLLDMEAGVEREALAALDRLDNGTYGTCERCGKTIPKGRLEAIPYVRSCVKCAS